MSNAQSDANLTTSTPVLQGGVAVEDEGALGLKKNPDQDMTFRSIRNLKKREKVASKTSFKAPSFFTFFF